MVNFTLNGKSTQFAGPEETNLLEYLRLYENIISVKDGCSGQGVEPIPGRTIPPPGQRRHRAV